MDLKCKLFIYSGLGMKHRKKLKEELESEKSKSEHSDLHGIETSTEDEALNVG